MGLKSQRRLKIEAKQPTGRMAPGLTIPESSVDPDLVGVSAMSLPP